MKSIDKVLAKLENCITNNSYEALENHYCEIKDNSSEHSKWKEIFITACAFLNKEGGYIIIRIRQDLQKNKYILTGYDDRNENKFVSELPTKYTDSKGKPLDLTKHFSSHEIRDFLDKRILIIYVEPLPDEEKYAFYNGKAYERKLTGDHVISKGQIVSQEEYKRELEDARELLPVVGCKIENLNVDKLNEYIQLLNKENKIEAIKTDIQSAKPFLIRKNFIRNDEPTLLGVLVCGDNIEDFLGNKCQVDCYVDVDSELKVAEGKRIIRDNILRLMERSISFINQNIKVGVIIEGGGKSSPEYPERLIRESVNNSLAHRDYSINRFININIRPNKHIEIRNPGRFKDDLVITYLKSGYSIRRIIPGNPRTNNPKLADVLKVYDKWEGRGLGMATLTNDCLDNKIDLPYYIFHSANELSLFIPKGRLYDEKMDFLFDSYSAYISRKLGGKEITFEQKVVLSYFYKSEQLNKQDRYTILLNKDNNHHLAITSLEESGLIKRFEEGSNDVTSVYLLDHDLFREDFTTNLRKMFGADFDVLSRERKHILQIVYLYNTYSNDKYPNANKIGNMIWSLQGKAAVLEGFEAFKRKIRLAVNAMEKRGLITIISKHQNRPQYSLNDNFARRPSLYDDN